MADWIELMLGIGVVILLTWLLLRYILREPIGILGIAPTRQRVKELSFGMLFMAVIGVINFIWQAHFKEISYQINPEYGLMDFLMGAFWVFRAVLFEELIFRGVLLFVLIKYLGTVKACLISATIFGIYHWFSYEVFGARLILMIYIFLVTGAGGWMFAYAYAKTKSLFAPTGLHLGWNLVTAIVFSSGPIGTQLLIEQGQAVQTNDWYTLLFFTLQTIVAPGLVTWYLYKIYKTESPN